ncbi:hypothetical protein ACB094_02G176600 [Castanea mollissima]
MAKRLKFRISRVIPSFQSCCSKDPSTLPANPVPSFFRSSPLINLQIQQPPKSHNSSLRRHVSSALISVGCGRRSKPTLSDDDRTESTLEFHWEKEEEWHVVAKVYDDTTPRRNKIYNSSVSGESDSSDHDDDVLSLPPPPPPPPPTAEKKKRRAKKKKTTAKVRVSTSSVDISSSRSFSTDSSSEFNPNLETIREMPPMLRRKHNKKYKKRCVSKRKLVLSSPESESPARLSMFQRLIPCTVEGKVRESFAVVKKSEDPYEDFKRSMMEMILEKQMFDEKDLEQLLHCFLSLNDREHHGVIVQAFSEIWEALFCRRTSTRTSQRVSTF